MPAAPLNQFTPAELFKAAPALSCCSVHAGISMFLRYVLQRILSVLLPLSIASLAYLHLYPFFHGCAFPVPDPDLAESAPAPTAFVNVLKEHFGYRHGGSSDGGDDDATRGVISPAPFRLLVLADPQIEGDSSLPGPNDGVWERIGRRWMEVVAAETWRERVVMFVSGVGDILFDDVLRSVGAVRKRLDLFGNDYYLGHIYRTLRWWARPTHVAVLGDLIGSQWVSDAEFRVRSGRYWNRVFKGGVRVDDEITVTGSDGYGSGPERIERLAAPGTDGEMAWSNRIISLAGNHDIGYAGDITEKRIERFEREFGRHNWDMRFQYPISTTNGSSKGEQPAPSLHLVVLDSLLLDTPALTPSLQDKTYTFLNDIISHRSRPVEDRTTFTLLLTHLPLHKEAGVCTDAPYFNFFDKDDEKPVNGELRYREGGLREQNHISDHLSHIGVLQGIFGMSGDSHARAGGIGRKGLVLTGHDHTGCDVVHFVNRTSSKPETSTETMPDWSWDAQRYKPGPHTARNSQSTPSIREITLRSMMGEFGGSAGLLSLWFDSNPSVMEWKYDIVTCKLGVQHIWWTVHIIGLVTLCMLMVWLGLCLFDGACFLSGTSNGNASTERKQVPEATTKLLMETNGADSKNREEKRRI
ncbi:hypothetical protein PRK78_004413 [Emydomyces testavorans]|uniref:Calcineurin-like phosphoesterase domain-containing protein n=1 Tax=Emydomyces testavorans TaxID=2070801 RepID=A0AAF0IIK9_9EURO|nr:hypothetical protein PRK78_004413 [Emydomyces testavorans]